MLVKQYARGSSPSGRSGGHSNARSNGRVQVVKRRKDELGEAESDGVESKTLKRGEEAISWRVVYEQN